MREAEKLQGGRPIGRRQSPPVFPLLTKGLGQSPALCFTVGSVMGFCRVPDDAEGLCESPEEPGGSSACHAGVRNRFGVYLLGKRSWLLRERNGHPHPYVANVHTH